MNKLNKLAGVALPFLVAIVVVLAVTLLLVVLRVV